MTRKMNERIKIFLYVYSMKNHKKIVQVRKKFNKNLNTKLEI